MFPARRPAGYDDSFGTLNDREIDFIASGHNKRLYVQVCLTLEQVKDNHPKLVLSLDEYEQVSRSGIAHQNLRNWLVE